MVFVAKLKMDRRRPFAPVHRTLQLLRRDRCHPLNTPLAPPAVDIVADLYSPRTTDYGSVLKLVISSRPISSCELRSLINSRSSGSVELRHMDLTLASFLLAVVTRTLSG